MHEKSSNEQLVLALIDKSRETDWKLEHLQRGFSLQRLMGIDKENWEEEKNHVVC